MVKRVEKVLLFREIKMFDNYFIKPNKFIYFLFIFNEKKIHLWSHNSI